MMQKVSVAGKPKNRNNRIKEVRSVIKQMPTLMLVTLIPPAVLLNAKAMLKAARASVGSGRRARNALVMEWDS